MWRPSRQCASAIRAASSARLDPRRDRRAAGRGVEERHRVGAPAEHGHAEGLEHLGRGGHVQERLDARRDDERLRAGQLAEVGGDVGRRGEAAMDAAEPAGAHEADSGDAHRGERAADRGRAERALGDAGAEVARADLPRLAPGSSKRCSSSSVRPIRSLPVDDPDRGRDRAGGPHAPLGLAPDRRALAGAGSRARRASSRARRRRRGRRSASSTSGWKMVRVLTASLPSCRRSGRPRRAPPPARRRGSRPRARRRRRSCPRPPPGARRSSSPEERRIPRSPSLSTHSGAGRPPSTTRSSSFANTTSGASSSTSARNRFGP